MPLNREDLAAAARQNDRIVDAGGSIPPLLMTLGVEPMSAVYLAEQRALRVAMIHSGTNPRALQAAAERGIAFTPKLDPRQSELIPVYASLWVDGLACALRAYMDALQS